MEIDFISVKIIEFPSVNILKSLPNISSLYETILVTSNDVLVRNFLSKKIEFNQIIPLLISFLKNKEFQKFKRMKPKKIQDIIELSEYVRLKLNTLSI